MRSAASVLRVPVGIRIDRIRRGKHRVRFYLFVSPRYDDEFILAVYTDALGRQKPNEPGVYAEKKERMY